MRTWPRALYCSMLPARGRTWREVKRTTKIPKHRLRTPRGNIEHWGKGIARCDLQRVGSCAEAVCVDRRSCCELISINRRPGHEEKCSQHGRRRSGFCVRARAALMLMRGAFGARIGMHLLARWLFGVGYERRACVWWHGRFVRGPWRYMQPLGACPGSHQTRAGCWFRLIPTEPGLIPHKKTTNPTNPTNPDLQIIVIMNVYLKIRVSRISGISRVFEWDSSRISKDQSGHAFRVGKP